MKRLIYCGILIVSLGISISLFGQGNLGQAGTNFLQIEVDPRGAALGGAVMALTEGAQSLYWNPAGAKHTDNMDIYLSHTNWFLDTKVMYGAVTKRLGRNSAIGASVTSFYMDDMEITTVYQSEGTGEFYKAGDLAAGLSYALSLTDRFTFGLTAKYVHEFIWNETASQFALDVGSLYQTDFLNLRLGIAVRNFGGKLKFKGDDIDNRIQEELNRNQPNNPRIERLTPEFRMPQVFQLGLAFEPFQVGDHRLTFLGDVTVPSDNVERYTIGAEFVFLDLASIRGAYRINHDLGQFSLGGGVKVVVSSIKLRLDYAFSDRDVLGSVHQFGFGFSF
jgi:hypothetical protein